jgi:cell division protein FtsZ
VDIFALNTDYNSLLKLKGKTNTILLGKTLLRGAGSGGDPLIGECAVKENIDTLKEILSGTDVLFIIAGLGKGTGSGASPEIAKVAKELNILVISIVNLPSIIAEGTEVYTNALGSFESLKANSDSITTISNDKIIKACGNIISFKEAFKEADEEVTSIVYEIVEGITVPSDVNVDLNDVKNFFKGNAVFLSRIISSEGDYDSESLYQLIQNALEKSYSNVSVSSQNISIIANLKISNKIPPSIVADISNIFKQISKGANIKIVNGINYSTDEKLRISLLISGNSDGTQSSSDTSHYENKPNNDYISFGNSGNNTSKLNPYKLFADTPTEKTRGLKVKKATLDKSRLIDDTFIDDETKEKDKYSEAMTKAVEGILGSSNEEDPKNN